MDSTQMIAEARGGPPAPSADLSGALAAESAAAVERVRAEYIMAHQRPRQMDVVKSRLLRECERYDFAERAWYEVRNRGSGLSTYFADAAARMLGNLSRRQHIVYQDEDRVVVRVSCADLETNFIEERDTSISKTVIRKGRRSELERARRVVLEERRNSNDEPVCVVRAFEEELLGKISAAASKARRQCTLQLLPAELLEDCADLILEVRRRPPPKKQPPNIKRMVAAFQEFRISDELLAEWIGKPVETFASSDVSELKKLYRAVREGEVDFFEELEKRRGGRS